jgi:hypothetical protein
MTIEAASTSEMSVNLCQTTWRNNPEDSHLKTYVCILSFCYPFTEDEIGGPVVLVGEVDRDMGL